MNCYTPVLHSQRIGLAVGRFVGRLVTGRFDGLAVGCLVGTGAFDGDWVVGTDVGRYEGDFDGDWVVGTDVGRNDVGIPDVGDDVGIPERMQLYPSAASEKSSLYPDL